MDALGIITRRHTEFASRLTQAHSVSPGAFSIIRRIQHPQAHSVPSGPLRHFRLVFRVNWIFYLFFRLRRLGGQFCIQEAVFSFCLSFRQDTTSPPHNKTSQPHLLLSHQVKKPPTLTRAVRLYGRNYFPHLRPALLLHCIGA